jgi:transcriptional regulator with XRE-family HTH domain
LSLIWLHSHPVAEDIERRRRGFWMRMARERASLSQESAAKELGLSGASKGTLSAWESGRRDPSATMIGRMARLYGVSPTIFMEPEPTAHERIDERMASAAGSFDAVLVRDGRTEAAIESKDLAAGGPERRRAWWLRDLREKRGLSQGQVAQRVGTNTRTIDNWEQGIGEPSIRQESAMAELLGAPIRRPTRTDPGEDGERSRRSA